MATPHTHKKLTDVKDSAPEFGLEENGEARFAKYDLDAEQTGVSHHRLKPGKRQPFGHRHEKCEEVYVVLGGSGRIKLDAIRMAPGVTRAFEAGPAGIEILAFGPRVDGDGELIQEWWTD
ncbi:MAG: hypothetical protein H0X42_00585 [Solirubrobacterales bacterium]|nr:hypothetical protein [Solirubrobacterales bacterium]